MVTEMDLFFLISIIFLTLCCDNYCDGILINETDVLEYVLLGEEHPCARKCVSNSTPMTCRYNFIVEWYHTMSKACYNCPFIEEDCFRPECIPGDGHKRPVLIVNRKMPGPTIEVCLGDEVIIDVENHLPGDSTTIHWHGHHQKQTPYMDGVPFVTQCPINSGNTFRYQFLASNPGTHFWHSHTGFQRADGAFGAFIVRIPEEDDPHSHLYDFDLTTHVMIILDWGQEIGLDKFLAHHHNDGNNKPATLLINGYGRFKEFSQEENKTIFTPSERFLVEQGYRYRFRIINAGFLNCPIEVSIDNHTLTVISSDGNDFETIKAESIVTYAGERFDFILEADQPKDVYWIRFSGLMDCDERFTSAHQVAILQYKGSDTDNYATPASNPSYEDSKKPGAQINSLNKGTEENGTVYVTLLQLKSLNGWDVSLKKVPDFQYYVSYDFYKIDNPHYHKFPLYGFHNVSDKKKQLLTPQLNHISMKLLPFPLLSQRDEIDDSMLCNETTVKNCETTYCECTHIINIPLNAVVEMVLIDKGFAFDANHPFHLHGHSFRVVAMERVGKNVTVHQVMKRDKDNLIKRNLVNAPIKDTVTVPDGGYTIIRFQASNPGYWLFHCHIEFHVEVGMAIVFKIGKDDEMPAVPYHFPKCGNYIPTSTNLHDYGSCGDNNLGNLVKKYIPSLFHRFCTPLTNKASNHSDKNSRFLVAFIILCKILLFRY